MTPLDEGPLRLPGLSPFTPIETAARDLSAGLQTILDHSPAAVFVKRVPDWRYLLVNRTFEQIFRLRREDVVGRRDEDFLPPDIVAGVRVLDEKVLATGEAHSAEERVLHADGSTHTYFATKFPLRNSAGEIYAVCGMATDITERKRAEDTLNAILRGTASGTGEQFLRSLVMELSRALGVRWAFVGKLVDPRRERVRTVAVADSGRIVDNFEYDLQGTPCADVVAQTFCVFPSGVAEKFPTDQLLRDMGVVAYMGLPLGASDGSPLGLVVALHDHPLPTPTLTQEILSLFAARAASELQRLDTESRWKSLVESAPQFILLVDRDEKIRFINHVVPPLTMDQVLGASVHLFVPEAHRETVRSTIRGVLESGRVGWYETLGPGAGGEAYWYEVTVAPVFEDGRVTGAILIATEIHRRRLATEALRESEARWRTLVESAPEHILKIDRAGKILFMNRGLSGEKSESFLGRTLFELITPAGTHELRAALSQVFDGGEPRSLILQTPGPEADEETYEVNLGPIREEAGIREAILVAVNITRRKRLEEQLFQSQKMEAIGRLAGGVAHDFNNLLTVIQGHLALQRKAMKADDPLGQHTEAAFQASQRAAELTQQLLTFSRKSIQKPVILDLNTLLKEQEKMLRRLIGEHIDLVVRPAAEPCLLRCDAAQLHQVVLNLAVNARDAMPTGGKLLLATRRLIRDETPFVELEVSDSGVGIPAAVLPRIFEPFFTTKEDRRGTGLGLAIVHGVVEQAGGSLQVRSRVGEGTTFTLQFPLVEGPLEEPPKTDSGAPKGGRESILVVEDEAVVRKLTRDILARHGYRVLEAAHGAEALLILERPEEPVDLLLSDIVMPGMSGRQLAEKAASIRPGLRVLFVTGYTDDDIVHHGFQASEIDLLEKPYLPQVLLKRVREILDRPVQGT